VPHPPSRIPSSSQHRDEEHGEVGDTAE
jgi:hypothetical protein